MERASLTSACLHPYGVLRRGTRRLVRDRDNDWSWTVQFGHGRQIGAAVPDEGQKAGNAPADGDILIDIAREGLH